MKRIIGVQFNEIKLNEGTETFRTGVEQVQLLRVGEFNHSLYGKFKIDQQTLFKLKENFDNKVRRIDLAVDYFHESNKVAAGWISNVELREEGQELWVTVDWTKNGKERIEDKELRYISADFDFNYTDSETSINYGPTLLGAGLTNRPHVKDMQPILLEEIKKQLEENLMDFEQLKEALMALSADQKAQVLEMLKAGMPEMEEQEMADKKMGDKEMDEHKKEMDEHKKEMDEHDKEKQMGDMEKRLSDIQAENKKLKDQILKTEKESSFNVLLSEGKVVEAQRESFIKGDMEEFVKNSVALNLDEKGSGSDNNEELDAEKANIKLSEIADKISEERKISYSQAMSYAIDENEELAKLVM